MEILLYGGTGRTGRRIKQAIEACIPGCAIAAYDSQPLFTERLRQSVSDVLVSVILASSRQELAELLELKSIIAEMRTILILPDRTKKTMAMALQFYPRFVGYGGDVQELTAVLRKMGKNMPNAE